MQESQKSKKYSLINALVFHNDIDNRRQTLHFSVYKHFGIAHKACHSHQ